LREESNLQPAVDKIESLHTEPTSENVLPQLISGKFVEDWQLFHSPENSALFESPLLKGQPGALDRDSGERSSAVF
jgi:hypothetical protein